jgi:hypothetical protein
MVKMPLRPIPMAGVVIGATAILGAALVMSQLTSWPILQVSNHSAARAAQQPSITKLVQGSQTQDRSQSAPAPAVGRATQPAAGSSTAPGAQSKVQPYDRCSVPPGGVMRILPMCLPAAPQP